MSSVTRLPTADRSQLVAAFASGSAHDFGNVLSCIGLMAELARRECAAAGVDTHKLEHILAAVENGRRLVRGIVQFAAQEPAEPQRLGVGAVLSEIAALLAETLPEAVSLTVRCAPGLPDIYIDRSQLERILTNLVVNARDAMPEGGEITIDAAAPPGAGGFARRVRIRVADTGKGIAPAHMEKVFTPFFTTKPGGAGLGLASCQLMAAQAGGAIRVESEPGQGVRFILDLPCAPVIGIAA